MRTHSLKEYRQYLENLRDIIVEGSESYLTENWKIFKNAKESMKAPGSGTIVVQTVFDDKDEDDFLFFSGGSSCMPDYESKEQSEAAKKVREQMDRIMGQHGVSVEGIDTLDRDRSVNSLSTSQVNLNAAYYSLLAVDPLKTESADTYIGAIHSFDEAQDSFFQGFLKPNIESTSLDDFFKETLV